MNPFDLRGPDFLALYLGVMAVVGAFAAILRMGLRTPNDDPDERALDLDAFQIAYLRDGARGVALAALASLEQLELLDVDVSAHTATLTRPPVGKLAAPVERVAAACASPADLKELIGALESEGERQAGTLRARGLLLDPSGITRVRVVPALLIAAVGVFGFIKILVGLNRNRPVGLLVLLLLLVGAALLASLVVNDEKTGRGRAALEKLRVRYDALRATAQTTAFQAMSPEDVSLAVGIFGPAVLAGTLLEQLHLGMFPVSAGGSGSGCSSGSSGSCGSSCGGGCGGGCGGCGG